MTLTHEVTCHFTLADYLASYIEAASLTDTKAPLFQSIDRTTGRLTGKPLTRGNALAMVKRRAAAAGVSPKICNHTFRGTGITALLENGGSLDRGSPSPRRPFLVANHQAL